MRKLIIVAAATMMFAACGSKTEGGSAVSSPSIATPASTTVVPPTSAAPVVVSMEGAWQQYVPIADDFNDVVLPMGDVVSFEECPAYLAASQTFVDDLKDASWPATVNDQLNELVQAGEQELALRDEDCGADEAELDTVITRINDAVDAWKIAIGAPSD